jgi:eukaryotic-like serine/threonine-protein kinase
MSLLTDGQIIRGTFEIERFLGEGAFGEVYRVKHRFLGRQAMKVLKAIGMTRKEIENLLSEAILLSRIGHPNIVRVFDANITETSKGTCGFFTMEYVAGGTLEQFWRSHGSQFVPIETVLEIMQQVCRGLSVAHREKPPIIHRDIKPQNILVGYDASGLRARISDFGLAKRANPLTLLATALGTWSFKAPEVFLDKKSDSCAGDVWALGSMMYLLFTDRLPFSELDEADMLDSDRFERPLILPSRLNAQVDHRLDQIVLKALSLKPGDRYQNASQLLHELEKWKPRKANTKAANQGCYESVFSKSALGQFTTPDDKLGEKMAGQALKLAQKVNKLSEAADLMEESFNKCPELREQYEYHVKLWRRGMVY